MFKATQQDEIPEGVQEERTPEASAQDAPVWGGQEEGAYSAERDEKEQSVRLGEILQQVYILGPLEAKGEKKHFRKENICVKCWQEKMMTKN